MVFEFTISREVSSGIGLVVLFNHVSEVGKRPVREGSQITHC